MDDVPELVQVCQTVHFPGVGILEVVVAERKVLECKLKVKPLVSESETVSLVCESEATKLCYTLVWESV